MNGVWLVKPNGYDKHILLADNPFDIGNSIRLNNGYFDEDYIAIEKSNVKIVNKEYVKVKMQGQYTNTYKDVYYKKEV